MRPTAPSSTGTAHAFTLSIDWEDFGQLMRRDYCGQVTPPTRTIERQTGIILEMLAAAEQRATFFILGMLARHRPDLVREIAAAGHEIALHGENHRDMRKLSREEAAADLRDAQRLVCDIIGGPVFGYRAPYFSIAAENYHVLESAAEMGLAYDSSIFPMRMRRYGIEGFPPEDALYQLANGRTLVELPISVAALGSRRLPVAGGGYMRLLPKFFLRWVFRRLDREGRNVMLYMHPYEFDSRPIRAGENDPPGQARPRLAAAALDFKWNLFRGSIAGKIDSLLRAHRFITCAEKAEYVKSHAHSPRVLGRPE